MSCLCKFMTSMRYKFLISIIGLQCAYLDLPDDCTHCRDVYSISVCDHSLRPFRYINITPVSLLDIAKIERHVQLQSLDMHI